MTVKIEYCDHLDEDSNLVAWYDIQIELGDKRCLALCKPCGEQLEADIIRNLVGEISILSNQKEVHIEHRIEFTDANAVRNLAEQLARRLAELNYLSSQPE